MLLVPTDSVETVAHNHRSFSWLKAVSDSRPELSGVVLTRNEADRIERCVRSLLPVCAEVVVLDSGSTDDTVARARAAGARVETQAWLG
ncbi:MAG TPA: glycosyltransferase, partial [Lysobacter sp.]|nr:glycosyltransferase [Lysobacter sp.]